MGQCPQVALTERQQTSAGRRCRRCACSSLRAVFLLFLVVDGTAVFVLTRSGGEWVVDKNSHDHLLAGEQGVADELARAQRHLCVGHVVGWVVEEIGDGLRLKIQQDVP